jgi:hypothetical protein
MPRARKQLTIDDTLKPQEPSQPETLQNPQESPTIETVTDIPMTAATLEAPAETAGAAKPNIRKGTRLEGDALLALAAQLGESVEENDFFYQAGYYSETLDDEGNVVSVRYFPKPFYSAYIAAQGLKIKPAARAGGGPGSRLRTSVKVAKSTRKISVGGHFSEIAGFNEGDKVKIDAAPGQITITLFSATATASKVEDEDDDEDF